MTGGERREWVESWLEECGSDALLADGLDEAIVGVGRRLDLTVVVYDREVCVSVFMAQGMSQEEAEEWMAFNAEGAWMGEGTPVFLSRCPE